MKNSENICFVKKKQINNEHKINDLETESFISRQQTV